MNNTLSKIIIVLAVLATVLNLAYAAPPRQPAPQPSAMLIEVESGRVLHATNEQSTISIASMTKVMTVLAIMEARQDLDEVLTVTGRESSSRIRRGMRLSRRDLIELTLVSSDNLAARTLIEHYPESGVAGIVSMNHIAERIGAHASSFVEPTGLLAGNKSTAQDLVLITQAAAQWPIFTEMANREKSSIKIEKASRARKIIQWIRGNNTNPFAHEPVDYEIIVAKTGLTRAAGWCLTMMFKYKQKTYVMVTAGNRDKFARKRVADYLIALVTDDRYRVRLTESGYEGGQ